MSSDVPPGVIKGTFTISPNVGVTIEQVVDAVKTALHPLKAPHTIVVIKADYEPIV